MMKQSATVRKQVLEVKPGIWLDYRRAVFLENEGILAVADLHLGYAWAHRFNGQMMPLHPQDELQERLAALCKEFKPGHLAILGDIVHQAVPVSEVWEELSALFRELSTLCGLKLILGNHDKKLRTLARDQNFEFLPNFETERFLLTHGDELAMAPAEKFVVMGHEHPSISLGDGIASAKFPCFLVSEKVLIVPAFSNWSAGTNIRAYPLMSTIAKQTRFERAIAICGTKLLPVKLG